MSYAGLATTTHYVFPALWCFTKTLGSTKESARRIVPLNIIYQESGNAPLTLFDKINRSMGFYSVGLHWENNEGFTPRPCLIALLHNMEENENLIIKVPPRFRKIDKVFESDVTSEPCGKQVQITWIMGQTYLAPCQSAA